MLKRKRTVWRAGIPLLCAILLLLAVFHLTPELSIRSEMLWLSPTSVRSLFSGGWYFHPNPRYVPNLPADRYVGKGTLYAVGLSGNAGYCYYLVNRMGFLYLAKRIGSA